MRNSCLYKNTPKTFRRSSSKILGEKNRKNVGWGTNLQNIEKGMRAIYEPDGMTPTPEFQSKCSYWLQTGDLSVFTQEELEKVRVFLQTDQSGAEALIVAYDCENKDYRQLFIHNVKPHVYVALKLFKEIWKTKALEHGLSISTDVIEELCVTPIGLLKHNPAWRDLDLLIKDSDNWSLKERYYYLAKQTCHSANYQIQKNTFRMNLLDKSGGKVVLSSEEADRFLMVYRALFPEIPERNLRVRQQVDETGLIFNMFGFPCHVTETNINEGKYMEYYAWGPQSTVGEITRIAFTNMQSHIESNRLAWDLLADTHDSFLVQCPLYEVTQCRTQMSTCMNQRLKSPIDGVEFSMKSETNIGFNWSPAKLKEKKNITGLQEVVWLN